MRPTEIILLIGFSVIGGMLLGLILANKAEDKKCWGYFYNEYRNNNDGERFYCDTCGPAYPSHEIVTMYGPFDEKQTAEWSFRYAAEIVKENKDSLVGLPTYFKCPCNE